MEVKATQLVTLWDGRRGHVKEVVSNKANIILSNGRREFVDFDYITAAIDTFSEKDAKFLAAKDKLQAFKQAAKKTAGMSSSEFEKQYGLYVSRSGSESPEWVELGTPADGSKFAVTFIGKEATAIGITYPMYGIVYAADEEAAKLKLYDKYDHIKQFKAKKVDDTIAASTKPASGYEIGDQVDILWGPLEGHQGVIVNIYEDDTSSASDQPEYSTTIYDIEVIIDGISEFTTLNDKEFMYAHTPTSATKASKAVQAPGHVDEDIWDKAKAAVKESSGKNIDSFGDKEWATVTTVYKNMGGRLKSEAAVDANEKGVVPSKCDKTAAHPNDYAVKYPAGTILVQDGKAEEFIHVLDYVPESKNYILTKRPVPADQAEGKLQGARYELSAKTVDSDKSLRVFSGKAVDAGKPSDLVATAKIGENIKLSFKEFDAVYTPEGILASTTATPKQFSKEYRKEFGLMVKNMGFDKISSMVMQKRLASKLSVIASEGPYKSDADIASEFEGMVVNEVSISKDLGNGALSGSVIMTFPAPGESVAGGQEEGEPAQVYDAWIMYNYDEWKESFNPTDPDGPGVAPRIAFNQWYPNYQGQVLKDAIIAEIIKEKFGSSPAAVEARLAKKLAAMEPAAVTKVEGAKPYTGVRVTFEDGNTVDTGINLTLEEARDYYLGKDRKGRVFNLGSGADGAEEDNMVKAVSVEEIPTTAAIARRLAKKAARLGNYDFDIHGGKNWVLEASEDGAQKIVRKEVQ